MCKSHTMGKSSSNSLKEGLKYLLRPIIRYCIKNSLKFSEFLEEAKALFIELSKDEIINQKQDPSISKISVISGLNRRDVTRLLSSRSSSSEGTNLLRKVLGHWESHPKFSTAKGKPRSLSVEGRDSEFSALVKSVSQDLNSYTILFELERVGAVKRKDGKVVRLREVFVPSKDIKHGFRLLGGDIQDLVGGVSENILSNPVTPNLHIKTHYDNINVKSLPKIREWLLEKGASFHDEVRRYLSKLDKDTNPKLKDKIGGARVAVGTFSLIQDPKDEL